MADVLSSAQITVTVDGNVVQEEFYPLDAPMVERVHKSVRIGDHEVQVSAQFDPPLRTPAPVKSLERLRGAIDALRDPTDRRWQELSDAYDALPGAHG